MLRRQCGREIQVSFILIRALHLKHHRYEFVLLSPSRLIERFLAGQ